MIGFKEKQETQAKQHFFAASVHEWVQTTPTGFQLVSLKKAC